MKITATQLRALIKEAISKNGAARPDRKDSVILSDLKSLSPRAYARFVEYLVEDCQDVFVALGDGRFQVTTDGGVHETMYWDDEYSEQEWEPTPQWEESDSDDAPKSRVPGPRDPFESSRQYKQATKKKK